MMESEAKSKIVKEISRVLLNLIHRFLRSNRKFRLGTQNLKNYRGHRVEIDIVYKGGKSGEKGYQRISVHDRSLEDYPFLKNLKPSCITLEQLRALFSSSKLSHIGKGEINAISGGSEVYYDRTGHNDHIEPSLLSFLCDLVDFYPAILKFEGEAIPYLLEISMNKNSPLRFLALQLLREISAITKNRLEKGDYSKFLCPNCFIRFSRNELQLPEGEILVCYGCRVCGRSKRLWCQQRYNTVPKSTGEKCTSRPKRNGC